MKRAHTEEIPWWVTLGQRARSRIKGCKAAHEVGSGALEGSFLMLSAGVHLQALGQELVKLIKELVAVDGL